MILFILLLAAGPTLAWALPPSAEPRVFIPTGTSAPEPYQWLNGGGFTGPPIPFHPDPLARYTWADTVNASKLQIFGLLPANVTLTLGTPPDGTSFTNLSSLYTPSPYVAVTGFGGLQLDFGVNNAAWIEFDSPDLTPQDAASVTLGVSEYNEIEVTNLGYKVAKPVPYPGATQSTYRLEISHPDGSGLYEGVRFGWLLVNSTPAQPWHITGLRIVVQAKPTNWGGAFAAEGDDLLSTIWYTGAYTVKANLLGNQFGSILIYRGDRYSWGGDAHVAQATAMAALGNFAFVGQNLNFTRDNCNGIESYCLYVVLSVVDYFEATGDVTTVVALGDGHVVPKLEHAYTIWGTHIGSYEGWDDRLGSGFSNPGNPENVALYRHLSITAWRGWAKVLRALGNATSAAHFEGYATECIAKVRANASWSLAGAQSTAEAMNGGWVTPVEVAAAVTRFFNDTTTICSLSAFNTYFVLKALGAVGELDRAYAVIHQCWDVMIELGATTTWETSKPGWVGQLAPLGPIPAFQDGFTSMAHPWSSGATQWMSQYLGGVTAVKPGFEVYRVAPHLAGVMRGVHTKHPLVGGEAVEVRVVQGRVCVAAPPAGREGVLVLSPTLVSRMGGGVGVNHTLLGASSPSCLCGDPDWVAGAVGSEEVGFHTLLDAPIPTTLSLVAGGCNIFTLTGGGSSAPTSAPPPANPFPPTHYPAPVLPIDTTTQGTWVGKYGTAGYFLAAYDGPGLHRVKLPPWLASIQQVYGPNNSGPWLDPAPGADPRALQDPTNPTGLPRKIGQFTADPPPGPGWAPSFPFDIRATPGVPTPWFSVRVYVVDYDGRGRKESLQVMDGDTLEDIAPVVVLEDFTGGAWVGWQWNNSVRVRVNYMRGTNQVLSAFVFDTV